VYYCNWEARTQASTKEAIISLLLQCLFDAVYGTTFPMKKYSICLTKLLSKEIETVLEQSEINSRSTSWGGGEYSAKITDLQADVSL